jgi:hypothetical protein
MALRFSTNAHLLKLSELKPGDLFWQVRGPSSEMVPAILVGSGTMADGRFALFLRGPMAYVVSPTGDPNDSCLVASSGDRSLRVEEKSHAGSVRIGTLALCETGAYVQARYEDRNDVDPCVINLDTWTLDNHLPRGKRYLFSDWEITSWNAERKEAASVIKGSGENT